MRRALLRLTIMANFLVAGVFCHGRLVEPPSRASMWKFGFDSPPDYNDHESYCGGFSRQWLQNGGKCGICGDPYDVTEPRPHETGGKYGNSIIVRRYRTGSVIPVRVQLTANHFGYFEFRICPMTYQGKEVSQECLDKHVLQLEQGDSKYYPGQGNQDFDMYLQLPEKLTCVQCVFQWRYIAGNNWGDCGNGTGAVGCGNQEEFRACADVAIGDDEATLPPRPDTTSDRIPSSTEPTFTPDSSPAWVFNFVIAGTCLLVILAALALVYTYYYHADKAKKWLMSRRWMGTKEPPVAPPRHRRHLQPSDIQLQF